MIKSSKRLLLLCLLSWAAASVPPALAQATSPVTPLMLQQWRLGQELGRYGLAQNDPYVLLAAARLQRQSGMQPSRARVEADQKDVVAQTDAAGLLAQAKTLAKDQPELLALIEESMVVRRRRGTVIGPQVQPLLMGARDTKPILLSYKPGQKAFFGVSSDRMQDIDFTVQGAREERLCEPAVAGGEKFCEWVSGTPADVKVVVTNRSAQAVMLTFFHD
ncbi:hypothetical protein FN976_18420 [Caenimonas sedimenti]|uniref:Uncharacterized protein n=1 Tax=Caenimonas sedimenti TaxID=2596921 RepID=A0A562ZNR6_9BURK|nr:hypothetical protein [Caenimonas sedimenti]TWO69794.1 hypothetical protein FN976_18420 [Caenimonas sedimenti]